jgi:PAS domain S-box-containing protein
MKTNTKILIGFLSVALLIIAQMAITHKLQSDFYDNTLLIKEVEAPLETMSEKVIGYDGILTAEAYAIVLHAQKGDLAEVREHRARYDEIGIKLDDLLKKDAKILIVQSKRSQEEKDKTFEYIKNLDELNLKLVDLETRAFEAIDKKDLDAAYSLVVGEDYHQYKQELYQEYRAWADSEHETTLIIRSSILKDSQQIIYFNLGISIGILIMTILTMLVIRSFVAEQYRTYKLLFDSSRDALMTLKPPTWNFSSGNKATLELFNLKDEKQLASLTPENLSPEIQSDGQLSGEKAKAMIEKAMKEGSAFFEWTHRKYKGEDFFATVLLSRIEEKDETFLQATVRDVSEQKKAKTDLNIFKNATESSSDAIGMATSKGRHYYQNKAFDEMFGDVGNDPPGSIYVDKEVGREVFQTIMAGDKWSGEVEMYGKGGKLLYIQLHAFPINDDNGKIVGLMGVHTDITERKKMEEKLKETAANKTS